MKKWFGREWFWLKAALCAVCGACAFALCACTTTTVYEMDGEKVVKKTVSEEPVTKSKIVGIFSTTTGLRIAVNGYSNDGSLGSIEVGETGNGYVSAPTDTAPELVDSFATAITNLHKNTTVSFKGYSGQASGGNSSADTASGTSKTATSTPDVANEQANHETVEEETEE